MNVNAERQFFVVRGSRSCGCDGGDRAYLDKPEYEQSSSLLVTAPRHGGTRMSPMTRTHTRPTMETKVIRNPSDLSMNKAAM